MKNIFVDGMMGLVIGDALGMPVQFQSREEVRRNPITGMRGYGTYNMPVGTWSDDSSMALATLDSIRENNGIDYDDIMKKFIDWTMNGAYTPTGKAFDQGMTCLEAIYNYKRDRDYKTCGKTGEWANGNGALMRIMPVCLYSYVEYKKRNITLEDAVENVHQVSALTHNHLRSKMACGIYFFMVMAILGESGSLMERLQKGMNAAGSYYKADSGNLAEWERFGRMEDMKKFAEVPDGEIRSSGYVVDSLEAAVWSLITTKTFEEGLLKGVNLGDDTDTVGAIAGGLAGLYYGVNDVPEVWMEVIIKKDEIIAICETVLKKFHI